VVNLNPNPINYSRSASRPPLPFTGILGHHLSGLFSLVTLLALRRCPSGHLPVQAAAWYHKSAPTFVDCLALVRQHLWRTRYLVNSALKAESVQLPREAFECLLNDLPLAA
jgi:hypothetical protein